MVKKKENSIDDDMVASGEDTIIESAQETEIIEAPIKRVVEISLSSDNENELTIKHTIGNDVVNTLENVSKNNVLVYIKKSLFNGLK